MTNDVEGTAVSRTEDGKMSLYEEDKEDEKKMKESQWWRKKIS